MTIWCKNYSERKTNRKIGFISSIVIGSAVAIFLICLIAALFNRISFTENLSYGVCAILSWGWVATAVAYSCYAKKERSAAAKIGVCTGVIYSTIISIVYFYKRCPQYTNMISFGYYAQWNFCFDRTKKEKTIYVISRNNYELVHSFDSLQQLFDHYLPPLIAEYDDGGNKLHPKKNNGLPIYEISTEFI